MSVFELPQKTTLCVNNNTDIIDTTHKLSSNWTLWTHLPHIIKWDVESYTKIFSVKTIEETICLVELLTEPIVINCMIFFMKKNITPLWEDPNNINGGCFSYKVSNKTAFNTWKSLCYCISGNTVSKNKCFNDTITGITISPKKNFCIIKIWLNGDKYKDPSIITNEIPTLITNGCLFKKHNK
jgi:hypothetical protein